MNRGLRKRWDSAERCLHSLTILRNLFRMSLKRIEPLKKLRISFQLEKSLKCLPPFTINPHHISNFSQVSSNHWDKLLTRRCRPKMTSLISRLVAVLPRTDWTWNLRSREASFKAVTKSTLSWIREKLNSKKWRMHYWLKSVRNNKRKSLKNRGRLRKKLEKRNDSELNTRKMRKWKLCQAIRLATLAGQLVCQPLRASPTWPCTIIITNSVLLAHMLALVNHSTRRTQKEVLVKWHTRPLNKRLPNFSNRIRLRHLKNHYKA